MQFSKCSPISLQSLNFTSLKLVLPNFVRLKLQFTNRHSVNETENKSTSEKSQLLKLQNS
ncbi:hypothetical protein E27107_80170 [Elizabethkingia anophelis]|nr:hypothetical protein E27107_80170 [Elizabethkingia anophelis]